jgi:hypothetical protein
VPPNSLKSAALLVNSTHNKSCKVEAHKMQEVSEGFVEDPWLLITLTVCHILH